MRTRNLKFKAFFLPIIFFGILGFAKNSLADTPITSLPYTINSSGTYYLNGDISSTAGGITISADGVTIEGNGHTITYGTSSSGDGIYISGKDNVTIQNLTVTQGCASNSAACRGIYIYGDSDNLTIQNTNVNISTSQVGGNNLTFSHAIYFRITGTSGITGLSIHNCTIVSNLDNDSASSGIFITPESGTLSFSGNIYDNDITVGGSNITTTIKDTCVRLEGCIGTSNDKINIYGNTFRMNANYQNQGILAWGSNYLDIHNNNVIMNCGACRGINIDGGSENCKIYDNDIDMNTLVHATDVSYGIRARFGADYNEFYSNTIDTSGIIGLANGIAYGQQQTESPTDTCDHNTFHSNIITGKGTLLYIYDGGIEDSAFYCNTYTATDGSIPIRGDISQAISNLTFSNETYNTSNSTAVSWTSGSGGSLFNVLFCKNYLGASPLAQGNISSPLSGWSINSASDCGYSCAAPDTTPPGAPSGLTIS